MPGAARYVVAAVRRRTVGVIRNSADGVSMYARVYGCLSLLRETQLEKEECRGQQQC